MKEVAILGAGYAGLRALRKLQPKAEKEGFHITLVNKNSYHYEATDLHEVAAGTQPKEKISYEIADVVNTKVTTFIQDEVVTVNTAANEYTLKENGTKSYDYVIVALGFESETFGIPGAKENALQMVDINTAVKVNEHIVAMMAKYKETQDKKYLNIAVCGAGFTGIELLGSLVEMKPKFAQIAGVNADDINIYCVEAATRLLPMFSEELAEYAISHLNKWGVQLLTGKPIKEIKPDFVVYQDNAGTEEEPVLAELEAGTIVWTTGVRGSQVMEDSGFDQFRGRVAVNADLTDPNFNNAYIIGDVSAVKDEASGRMFPTTAQIALKMGTHAAENILNQLHGQATVPFTFQSQGSVASIGNTHAFGVVGKRSIKGYPASFTKKMIMNKALLETGGMKEVFAKGRFDLYH